MFKAVFLIALAFGVASAQRWPMITVNAAGEIVLQSLTRAQSFQVTPASVTTAPTSSGTASLTTATALTAGVSAFIVTTATSPAAGHGVTLPAPAAGAQVTLLQGQTTFTTYTIWSSAASVFINSDASTVSITALSRRVVCQAISATRWNCIQDEVDSAAPFRQNNVISVTSATARSLLVSESGSHVYVTFAGTATINLPNCQAANVGIYYEISVLSTATTANTLAVTPTSSNTLAYTAIGAGTTATAVILGKQVGPATTASAVLGPVATTNPSVGLHKVFCYATGAWGMVGLFGGHTANF